MKSNLIMRIIFLLAVSATSCKKDNSLATNPSLVKPAVAFQLLATNSSNVLNRIVANTPGERVVSAAIQWTSASASVSRIKFEAKKSGSELEFNSRVQQTINLMTAATTLGTIPIPEGNYDKVEFKLELSANGSNAALELKGRVTIGTSPVNISFKTMETIEVKGEKENVTINAATLHKAITFMNLSLITSGISSSALDNAVKTNGDIQISSISNPDIYKIILKNIQEMNDEEDFH